MNPHLNGVTVWVMYKTLCFNARELVVNVLMVTPIMLCKNRSAALRVVVTTMRMWLNTCGASEHIVVMVTNRIMATWSTICAVADRLMALRQRPAKRARTIVDLTSSPRAST